MRRLKSSPFSFIIKFFTLLIIFGLFPAFVSAVAANYKHKADLIIDHEDSTLESARSLSNDTLLANAGSIRVLTEEQAGMIRKIKLLMLGKWKSLQDDNYTVEFLKNGTFTDKDSGNVVAYGTWSGTLAATSSGYSAASGGVDGSGGGRIGGADKGAEAYYLTKTQLGEKYKNQQFLYEIMQLDTNKAILYYTGNNKMLYFERFSTSTSINASTTAPFPVNNGTSTKINNGTSTKTTIKAGIKPSVKK